MSIFNDAKPFKMRAKEFALRFLIPLLAAIALIIAWALVLVPWSNSAVGQMGVPEVVAASTLFLTVLAASYRLWVGLVAWSRSPKRILDLDVSVLGEYANVRVRVENQGNRKIIGASALLVDRFHS